MTERDALTALIRACSGLSPHHVPSAKDWNAIRDAVRAGMAVMESGNNAVINCEFKAMNKTWCGIEAERVIDFLTSQYPQQQWSIDGSDIVGKWNRPWPATHGTKRYDEKSVIGSYVKDSLK